MKSPRHAFEAVAMLSLATSSCALFRSAEGLRNDIVDRTKVVDGTCSEITKQIEAVFKKAGGQKTIVGSSPYHPVRSVIGGFSSDHVVTRAGYYRFPRGYELEDAYVEAVLTPEVRTFRGDVHGRVSFFVNSLRESQAETFHCLQPAE